MGRSHNFLFSRVTSKSSVKVGKFGWGWKRVCVCVCTCVCVCSDDGGGGDGGGGKREESIFIDCYKGTYIWCTWVISMYV